MSHGGAARAVGCLRQVAGCGGVVGCLEGHGGGLAGVATVWVLEQYSRASEAGRAGVVRVDGEVFRVESEAEHGFCGGQAEHVEVVVDGGEGAVDGGVVSSDVVAPVHEIVSHDVYEIDRGPDGGCCGAGEGDHVACFGGDGDREELVADGPADGG